MNSKLLLSLSFILVFILCGGDSSPNNDSSLRDIQEVDQNKQQKDVYIIDYQADEIDVDRLISCLISKDWNNIPTIEGLGNTVQLIFDEPWDGNLYDSLADECEEEFKKDDEAIINFEKSIFLNKNFVQSLNILADIYINKGELTKALECLKKSVKLDMSKKNIKAINSLGMVITSIFLKDKDVEKLREAKKYFEKTYELDKDNDIFYNQLINFYHLSGMKNEAVYHSKNRTGVFII